MEPLGPEGRKTGTRWDPPMGYPFFTRINPPRKALVWRCLRVGLLCTCVLFSLGYGVRSSFQRHLRRLLHEEELPLFSRSSTYPIRLKTKVQRKVALSTRVLGGLHFKVCWISNCEYYHWKLLWSNSFFCWRWMLSFFCLCMCLRWTYDICLCLCLCWNIFCDRYSRLLKTFMCIWMTGHDVDLKALIVFSGNSCVWGKEPCIRSVLELLWNCCKMCPCVLLS